MDDDHACRIERKSYLGDLMFRVVCRCGYMGNWRSTEREALGDRLSHKRSLDVPEWGRPE